ncbi:hypothetical protein ILUMI_08602 [Ignelater luminosus]|uniref:Peptidase S1 domain-containing protein n=1 Tax=Ignelater luminosus TaxID=2038154 RepID=A0A8K0D6L2_IGNLU|nr:hypothetical protein ILUMI_08602 [Ignelater luminosus]
MAKPTFLVLVCFLLMETYESRRQLKDYPFMKFSGIDDYPFHEEEASSLRNKMVPLVVNPPEQLQPPGFSIVVFRRSSIIGSGAIIAKYFALTICTLLKNLGEETFDLTPITKIQYVLHNSSVDDVDVITPIIHKLIPHPHCGNMKKWNPKANIGLIQTKEPMDKTASLRYPLLLTSGQPIPKGEYILSNFRIKNPNAINIKQAIWYVISKPASHQLCRNLFRADRQAYDTQTNLCMSYVHVGDADSCKGDLGIPLSVRHKNRDYLIGFSVHKHYCGSPKEVASFILVGPNKKWIESTIKKLQS